MSHFLDRLNFFIKKEESYSDGHGTVSNESRDWEQGYRGRWQHDKVVRSTHGVNCTGSCSWKIFVKNGLITWEMQQTDYPRTRPARLSSWGIVQLVCLFSTTGKISDAAWSIGGNLA